MTHSRARKAVVKVVRRSGLAEPFLALRAEVEQLRADAERLRLDSEQLRVELVRLDADLDESRRLNLRAAELLDIVYEELGARTSALEETP